MTLPLLVRALAAPLEAALRQAQADLVARPAPAPPEEWLLPAGSHPIAAALALGAPGRSLRLTGPGGPADGVRAARVTVDVACTLSFAAGALALGGDDVTLTRVGVTVSAAGAAVTLAGEGSAAASSVAVTGGSLIASAARLTVTDVRVLDATVAGVDLDGGTVELTGARVDRVTGVGARITATISASASDLDVRRVGGARAAGVEIVAPTVRLAGVEVHSISEGGGAADPPAGAGVDGLHAAGVIVEATEHVEATSITVSGVSGASPVGIRILAGAEGPDTAASPPSPPRGLFLVDVRVDAITGSAAAAGVLLGAARGLGLRGFTVASVTAPRAAGVIAAFARSADVTVGRVESVLGAGGEAVGVRLLGGALAGAAVVSDLSVEAVGSHRAGGAPTAVPAGLAPPDAWEDWARLALGKLGDGADALAGRWGSSNYQPGLRGSAGDLALPPLPASAWVGGLHLGATADDFDPIDDGSPGALHVTDCTIRRVGGGALAIAGGLRPVLLRGVEIWAAASGGFIQGEELLAAELTLDTLVQGLGLGPGDVRIYDTIVSRLGGGTSFLLDPDAVLGAAGAVFTTSTSNPAEDARFHALGPIPYVAPGSRVPSAAWSAGEIPEPDSVDLELTSSSDLPSRAVHVPGDAPDARAFVGAIEPAETPPCDVRDPEPRPAPIRGAPRASSPLVEYTARDAPALLALMLDRTQAVMPEWTEGGAADFTTALLELLAERLDHLAYAQERTLGEGFLDTAVLRRSVEDLVRPLDCPPDPGLSATAMIRFHLDLPAGAAPKDATFTVPADTLIGNGSPEERSIVFATEEALVIHPELDRLSLAADARAGDTSARLAGPGSLAALAVGRWLVFAVEGDPHHTGHVVRITQLERAAELVEIRWDPRRPLPCDFAAPGSAAARDGTAEVATIFANVVPAHHGIPLRALSEDETVESDVLLGRYRHLMTLTVDGESQREVPLPLGPLSVQARGYPIPGAPPRQGVPALSAAVEGDRWKLWDDLSSAGPSDEVVALRAGDDGSVLRFGRDGNGADLPPRDVTVELDMRVGVGREGNVGVGRLSRLLRLGPTGEPSRADLETWLGDLPPGGERDDRLRALLIPANPLPALGGREPEPLDHLRYRAPLGVMDAQSAITAPDYERLLQQLPEVGAASARVIESGLRPRVQVTVLLRDEDLLGDDERLRRWAAVRRRLEEIRLLGFDVEAVPPRWVPLDLDVAVDADPHAASGALHDAVIDAVAGEGGLLDPDVSGLGGDVHLSSLYQAILAVPGVTGARIKRFRRLAPGAVEELPAGIIAIAPTEVAVLRAPARAGIQGLFTVTVCGGLL